MVRSNLYIMAGVSDVEANLQTRWETFLTTTGIEKEIQDKWWNIIRTKYSESTRKYHTLIHLSKMFEYFDTYVKDLQSSTSLFYAIYFHDLEYDVKSQENEENSVKLFDDFSKESGLISDVDLTTKVKDLILLSKTHCTEEHITKDVYGKEDSHYFLDFDVSILGSESADYKDYAAHICEEYLTHLTPERYNFLRTKVLTLFLQVPNIFATKPFRDRFEEQARKNIQDEIEELSKGK